MFPPLNIATR